MVRTRVEHAVPAHGAASQAGTNSYKCTIRGETEHEHACTLHTGNIRALVSLVTKAASLVSWTSSRIFQAHETQTSTNNSNCAAQHSVIRLEAPGPPLCTESCCEERLEDSHSRGHGHTTATAAYLQTVSPFRFSTYQTHINIPYLQCMLLRLTQRTSALPGSLVLMTDRSLTTHSSAQAGIERISTSWLVLCYPGASTSPCFEVARLLAP